MEDKICPRCGKVKVIANGETVGDAGRSVITDKFLCGQCLHSEAWYLKKCPYCGSPVRWEFDTEGILPQTVYHGRCDNDYCGTEFRCFLRLTLQAVEKV